MDAIKMVDVAAESLSFGRTDTPINTVASSVHLVAPLKAVSKPIAKRQKRRRKGSADANTLLAIAQSALARLADVGIEVYAKNTYDGVEITLVGVKVENKKLSAWKG